MSAHMRRFLFVLAGSWFMAFGIGAGAYEIGLSRPRAVELAVAAFTFWLGAAIWKEA